MDQAGNSCDPSNFERLYDEQSDGLYRFIYYKSGDSSFAEDVVQESFLRLWKNCAEVALAKAKSFLFTVANNLTLDRFKHQQVVMKFDTAQRAKHEQEDPQFLLEEKEFQARLEQAIADLPEKQRVVFLLNRIDKLTYREIAAQLELSQKAVEKRMHLALVALREKIGRV